MISKDIPSEGAIKDTGRNGEKDAGPIHAGGSSASPPAAILEFVPAKLPFDLLGRRIAKLIERIARATRLASM